MVNHVSQGPLPFIPLNEKILALPVIHGSAEITVIVRRVFFERPPSAVVLELPSDMRSELREAISHADAFPVLKRNGEFPLYLILEPLEPLVEGLRSAVEAGIPVFCIDRLGSLPSIFRDPFPDTYSLVHFPLNDLYRLYCKEMPLASPETDLIDAVREFSMAESLRQMEAVLPGPILFLCGIRHLPRIEKWLARKPDEYAKARDELIALLSPHAAEDAVTRELQMVMQAHLESEDEPLQAIIDSRENQDPQLSKDVEILSLSGESGEVLEQPAYYNLRWLEIRNDPRRFPLFDRILLQREVYQKARRIYEEESSEFIPPQREKLFFRFARNWSILGRRLLPDPYRLVIAARSFVNDNFARIFYDTLLHFEKPDSPFPEARVTLDDLYRDSKMIRFRMKLNHKPKVAPPKIRRGLRREKYPGEWKESFGEGGMCSYPPEDIIIEDFARYLQSKAVSLIKSNETRTLPFSSSLLDGIDYRETIRNVYQDRIYVKELRRRGAEAGSVVVIYSEDEVAYPWKVVWWGEHNQESDMAFYATPMHTHMVGPGISRCIYGGFLLTYPPGRLGDIWNDPFFDQFDKARDRLLAAAILYNEKNVVVHVAEHPPSQRLQYLAGRFGQKIAHFPLSNINPVQLNRVRRFHVLDGRDKRDGAGDYIW
jgi:hypothetical protein